MAKKLNNDTLLPIYANATLGSIKEAIHEICLDDPKEGAKMMRDFGVDGDWSLEIEYLKLIEKDLKDEKWNDIAKDLQTVINKLEEK